MWLQDGWTALYIASQNGQLPVVSALLERGADVAAVTKVGLFPALRRQVLRLWIWCGDRRFLVGFSVVYVVTLSCLALFLFFLPDGCVWL